MKKMNKLVIPAALVLMVAVFPIGVTRAEVTPESTAPITSGAAEVIRKSEVIYGLLTSDGKVKSLYAVNHFEVTKAGAITDYGDYSAVVNLTDTGAITQNGGSVTFAAKKGSFYYQGNLKSNALPWDIKITYLLNGAEITPEKLSGADGKLEIRISIRQNVTVSSVFFDNCLLQLSLPLSTDKCASISAPGAAVAEAGKNKIINFTVMPGSAAELSVSADVTDFALTGIDISAMPFSMDFDIPDTSGMTGKFSELSDAISALNDGVGKLKDGARGLESGSTDIKNGSAGIFDGLVKLDGGSAALVTGSKQIKDALEYIVSSINNGSADMSQLNQLPDALGQLADGLGGTIGGLNALKHGFAPALEALDGAISGIPDTVFTQEQIGNLYTNSDPSQHAMIDGLVGSYTAAMTVKDTYAAVKQAFDAVGTTIDTLGGAIGTISGSLDTIALNLSGSLSGLDMSQLTDGLGELSENYGAFHAGLGEYTNGVSELSGGYSKFHDGLKQFSGGISEFKNGISELHGGTTRLNDEASNLPGLVQSGIDNMLKRYTGQDFVPVSFISAKNTNVALVQFVLKCDGVEQKKEKTKSETAEKKDETFWNRLAALFSKKED